MPERSSITIATAGHVDHGKTSLVAKITGVDTDTLAEEKSRGVSINLGFAYYHIASTSSIDGTDNTIGFIDVPGHTDFINNALAGISVVDSALLVIAADDGIMPQTREHLAILNLLGINSGAIVLTKTDMSSSDRIEEVKLEVDDLVRPTSLANVPVFSVSCLNGNGIPPLVEYLQDLFVELHAAKRIEQRRFRFIIDRCFTAKGIGTVVTGTIKSGTVSIGDNLAHTRSDSAVRVKGLRHDHQSIDSASSGERVAININTPHQQIERGDWLLDSNLNHPINRIDANVSLLEPITFKPSVGYHLYHGASHHVVTIRPLGGDDSCYFQISFPEPVVALFGDRFVLRDPASAKTIGGGRVVDIFVPRRGRSSPERLAILSALDQPDYAALKSLLETQDTGVDLIHFILARNCTEEKVITLLDQLASDAVPFVVLENKDKSKRVLLHDNYFRIFSDIIVNSLATFHRVNGNQLGMSEPALSKATQFKNSHVLFHAILQKLIANASIKITGTLLHLPAHKVKLSQEEETFMKKVRPVLEEAGFLPPRTRELMDITAMDLRTLEKTLAQARKAGSLVQVAPNRHYLPETMMQLAAFTEAMAQEQEDGFSVIQFRDRIGIGRNLCIEILEHFDSVGFTRREGNSRFVRTTKENLFGNSD